MDERLDLFAVLASITDGVYVLDREGRYTFLNAAAERQVGLRAAELIGRHYSEVFPETVGSPFEDASRQVAETGEPVLIQAYYPPLDTWFESTYYPADGGCTIFSRDITAQKRAEADRERYRELLEESQRSGQIGSWEWEIATDRITWSDELYRIYGLTRETEPLSYDRFNLLVHPDDRAELQALVERAFREGTPYAIDHRIVRPDGEIRWMNGRGRAVRDDHGTLVRLIGSGQDITERKLVEAQLRASEQRHRLALDAAQAGTFEISLDVDVPPIVTPEVLRLYGFPPGATPKISDYQERIHPDDREVVRASLARSIEERVGYHAEYRVVRPSGEVVWIATRADALLDEHGRVQALVGVLLDITERRAAQQQQQEFLEAVSHDLKNPLGAVRAHVQLMKRRLMRGTIATDALPESLDKIDAATKRMESQIAELEDVARVRSGHPLELRLQPVDLAEVARAAVADVCGSMPHRSVSVEAGTPSAVGHWDPVRLRRVVDNLLSNALKYSDAGTVVVRVADEEADGRRWATLSVTDEGLGIPAADLPHIFERFRRGSNVTTRRRGTGIGLAGARQIVEQHGGKLTARSEEGRGSVFTVRLPIER